VLQKAKLGADEKNSEKYRKNTQINAAALFAAPSSLV